jgi:hypothetical protein
MASRNFTRKYASPEDVPLEIRRTVIERYESGVEPPELARSYELPVQWVELFVAEIEGEA